MLEIYFGKFTYSGIICDSRKDYLVVETAVLNKVSRKTGSQEVIREATDSIFIDKHLLSSLDHLDTLYNRAGLTDKEKFGFSHVTTAKMLDYGIFAI